MASDRQISANKKNARQSTGPKSHNGLRRVRLNALKHGLSAQTIIIKGESAKDFETLHNNFIEDLAPVDAMEDELVWKITMAVWRLRRVHRIEAYLFRSELESNVDDVDSIEGTIESEVVKPADNIGVSFQNMWCSGFESPDSFHAFNQLLRYEAAGDRSFYQALHALERLQAKRRGEHVPVPHISHVNIDTVK
jgi:hypothetical protein